jgi:crotonobetainyl-CoA:carnitine CoA-transferase CaiB-like acyl-CoA transferase
MGVRRGALEGRRVLELADETGLYCGKLLADLGADVLKIETPGGDATRWIPPFHGGAPHPDRSFLFLYMNGNKRSLELDLSRADDRGRFEQLAAAADVLVETQRPGVLDRLGLGYEAVRAVNPRIVFTSITGFGQSGPHRDFVATDIVSSAMGGAMYCIGAEEDPPVPLAGSQADVFGATCAAAASLIALYHAERTGRGQHVDISLQETSIAASHVCGVGKWLEDGIVPRRAGTGLVASVPSGAYPCADGSVYLMVNRPAHWVELAKWIHESTGNREVLDPMFEGPSSRRLPYRELLDLFITEFTAPRSVEALYREGQRRHIAVTPVNTASDIAREPHLAARAFFASIEHPEIGRLRQPGPPYRLAETPWRLARPAPRPGEHGEANTEWRPTVAPPSPDPRGGDGPAQQALAGLRIVEFGAGMAVPWIGRMLAWCGAEVIKVESRKYPDVTRLYIPPRAPELGVQPQLSPWFTDWNAGKRFVSLDLRRPEAILLCERLIARSDAVIQNYSTGVLAKLGLDLEALQRAQPQLVVLGSTGYGDRGPDRQYVTWGPNIEALSGLSSFSGFPDRDCTMSHFAYPDPLSAIHGLVALMAAFDHRERGGGGQSLHMAQVETAISALGPLLVEFFATGREPERLGNRSLHHAPQGCYPCRGEDRWCVVAVQNDEQWRNLCEVLGRADWRDDPRLEATGARRAHADALDEGIAAWTRERDAHDAMAALQRAGVPAGVVQTTEDLYERDPHLAARGFFEEIEHLAKGRVTASGIPLGLSGTPGRTPHAGEPIGRDNAYVFREIVGLSGAELLRLMEIGAIESGDGAC